LISLFQTLKNHNKNENLKVTGVSKCHRNEDIGTYGLERLNVFTMREIIFVDSPENITKSLIDVSNKLEKIFENWKIYFKKMNATDPFFLDNASEKRIFENIFNLKQEYKFYLPYNQKWLAIGSVNNHQNMIKKGFGISNTSLHSGCIAFGLERLAISIFSQFGTDISSWPDNLKIDLNL
jgi:seryl-tRNA synthetase